VAVSHLLLRRRFVLGQQKAALTSTSQPLISSGMRVARSIIIILMVMTLWNRKVILEDVGDRILW
jgi:hypothetical protein